MCVYACITPVLLIAKKTANKCVTHIVENS